MNEEVYPKEVIYVARTRSKIYPKDRMFAVHHSYEHNERLGGRDNFSYSISRDKLVGYLDGSTAIRIPRGHTREVVNGIPESVRKGFFPDFDIEALSSEEFVSICEEAHLGPRTRSGFVRLIPIST